MNKKTSKLEQITKSNHTTKSVFNREMFGGIANAAGIVPKTEDYTYLSVELGSINFTPVSYPSFLYDSIKNGRLVNPIILSYEYEIRIRGGREYREKTGRYNIVDGNARVTIFSQLFQEALAASDEKAMTKYGSIPALLLPLNISDEEIESIKNTSNEDKSIGTGRVIKDITETKQEQVTYCYKYEMAEIPLEKIVERDENKYKFTQSEIDELEKSIYHAGLMQPIMLLPIINSRTMEVEYEIEAGHKRTAAIRQLVKHAQEGRYENGEFILQSYATIPSLLIPMGATAKQVEQIYNDTNLLSRHMTTDDVFEHIRYFEELPSRPKTKKEYVDFKEKKYRIAQLSKVVQEKFKALGFSDWKNRKTSLFLTIYYYGSDKCLEFIQSGETQGLTLRDIEWIVRAHQDFNERKKQDEILERAMQDKTYLLQLMDEKIIRKTPKSIKIRKVTETVLKEKALLDKITVTPFDLKNATMEDIKNAKKIVIQVEKTLKDLKDRLNTVKIEENTGLDEGN